MPIETSKCLNSSSAQGCAKSFSLRAARNSESPQRCLLTLLTLRAGIAPAAGGFTTEATKIGQLYTDLAKKPYKPMGGLVGRNVGST